jgi:N-acyl-L-homoserine lactone synthetase
MSEELARYLVTFRAFDGAKCQNYIVAHKMIDAVGEAELNCNCKKVISVSEIEDTGPKIRKRSGWISDSLPVKNQLIETLKKLHRS